MRTSHRLLTACLLIGLLGLGVRSSSVWAAATNPSPTISPEARKILDQIRDAYAAVTSLTDSGKLQAHFDVGGQKTDNEAEFSGAYDRGRFRSEIKGDAIVGNTGQNVYVFLPMQNVYLMQEAPKDKVLLESLDQAVADLLREQNLPLALVLSRDAAAELTNGASSVVKIDDVKIDDAACPALLIAHQDMDIVVAVDSQTHLLRRQTVDLSRRAKQRGATDVKVAQAVMDFSHKVGGPVDEAQFAWQPPAGAQPMQQTQSSDLEGKPAPAFSLSALDGTRVSSADLQGTVYVLDFWATWCAPCVVALPEMDKTYQDFKGSAVKIFAVNQEEEKQAVQKFVDEKKLALPVLLDSDGKVSQAYAASALPQIVIVGKDAKVRRVFLGWGLGREQQIRSALQSVLQEK
ncbi:MAG: redoxin domain-containing protein [Tepidisphaeraceae bacterium]|jgi:peroxiredoxin